MQKIARLGQDLENKFKISSGAIETLKEIASDKLIDAQCNERFDLYELMYFLIDSRSGFQFDKSAGSKDRFVLYKGSLFHIDLHIYQSSDGRIRDQEKHGVWQVIFGNILRDTYTFLPADEPVQ